MYVCVFVCVCVCVCVCDKATLGMLGHQSVPDCYKNKQLCDKGVDNYLHALEFVLECYKTQKT